MGNERDMTTTPNNNANDEIDKQAEETGVTMGWMPAWFYDTLVYTFTLGREQTQRREILEVADIQPGNHVVDVGCGTGSLVLLAAHETQAARIVGVDPTESYLERARVKMGNDDENKGNVEFVVGKAQAMPLESGTFHVALSTFTFHHLPSTKLQEEALAEIKRVLRPAGKLVIVDFPNGQHPHHGAGGHGHQEHGHLHAMTKHVRSIFGFTGGHDHGHSDNDKEQHGNNKKDNNDDENDDLVRLVQQAGFAHVTTRNVSMMGAQAILANKAVE